jgi:hypothetical protein
MFLLRTLAAVAAAFALSACATLSENSEDRWYKLSSAGSLSSWALCVNEQSHIWLDDKNNNPEWAQLKLADTEQVSDARLFSEVVTACRSHISGADWQKMTDRQVMQIMSDAFRHFKRVEINILAAQADAVI